MHFFHVFFILQRALQGFLDQNTSSDKIAGEKKLTKSMTYIHTYTTHMYITVSLSTWIAVYKKHILQCQWKMIKSIALKSCLFIEIILKTLKQADEIRIIYDLFTFNIIS